MAKVKLKSYLKELHGRAGNYIHYNVNGKQYVRSYAVPANPRTVQQQKNRCTFAHAVKSWQELSPEQKIIYNRKAADKPYSGYNLFISMTIKGESLSVKNTGVKERNRSGYPHPSCIKKINSVPVPYLPGTAPRCPDPVLKLPGITGFSLGTAA